MTEMQKLLIWIMKITVLVLASVLISVVFAAIVGLFMPNELIDNTEIFALIGPAFQTIVGAFVGALDVALDYRMMVLGNTRGGQMQQ